MVGRLGVVLGLLSLFVLPLAFAQPLALPPGAAGDEKTLAAAMPALAARLIDLGPADGAPRDVQLDNLFRFQLVAGRTAEAVKTLAELRALTPLGRPSSALNVRYEIYADALRLEAGGTPFDDAFRESFRQTMRTIDDRMAYRVVYTFGTSPVALQNGLRAALARVKDPSSISTADATEVVRRYFAADAARRYGPIVDALIAEDEQRRYVIEKDIAVRTPDGATICAAVVRPRGEARLPALLNFTIYADPNTTMTEARRSASNGYAGVVGLTRGKGCSPDAPVPYEHDAGDAAAVVDWIAAQPWSDGRVGMFGGSYEGFTTWAAAKKMPKALKAIMDGAPVGPGIDVPMEGNVFWNFVYPWPFYTTDNKTLDDATYNDTERWQRLDRQWYVQGRAYRDRQAIDGTPNPIFQRWISHPAYDAWWRSMIPYGDEFARIGIPVLTTSGYYGGGPGACVYYFTEHRKHRPNAQHYLLVGPWDHFPGYRGTVSVVGTKTVTSIAGYEIEPVAHMDLGELRYEWFNYVFKGAPRPAILADRVNYMLVGANAWRHAPSIAAMADRTMRLHLNGERLTAASGPRTASRTLTVDLRDRSDADVVIPGGGFVDKALDTSNGLKFVSDPFTETTELSGLFSGHLEFVTNKKDFDLQVAAFELTAGGDYVQLAPWWSRASFAGHPERRVLLTPGKRQTIDFRSMRLMGRQVRPGSRIVLVINVIRNSGQQINYGTGKDVSDETIADAGAPLRIEWFANSWVSLPVRGGVTKSKASRPAPAATRGRGGATAPSKRTPRG